MPRVFLPFVIGNSETVKATGEIARYLDAVLRAKHGQSYVLFDPDGSHYEAEVENVSRSSVAFKIIGAIDVPEPDTSGCVLVCGILKGGKMELVIQKAVELGVSSIVPVVTRRTLVRETRKLKRWRSVALEAARQSGRAAAPPIEEPVKLTSYLKANPKVNGIVFYEEPGQPPLSAEDASTDKGNIVIAIGPEGGFEPEEISMMKQCGFVPRTLGKNVLRAETASIAAITIVHYLRAR